MDETETQIERPKKKQIKSYSGKKNSYYQNSNNC